MIKNIPSDKEILWAISVSLSEQIRKLEEIQKTIPGELEPEADAALSAIQDRLQEIVVDVNILWENQ